MSTDDQALFDAVLEGKEPETAAVASEATQPAEQAAEATQPRDDSGRFAAKDEPQPEEPALEAAKPEPAIPPGRLREEAEARRRAEAEASELRAQMKMLMERMPVPQAQPKPEQPAPDIFEAPDQWADSRIKSTVDPLNQRVESVVEVWSKRFAEQQHGAEKVSAAYDALDQAIRSGKISGEAVKAELSRSADPYGDILAWHGKQKAEQALASVGYDIEAYNQKILAEAQAARAAPQATPAAQQPGTIVKLPSNLNRITSAASSAPGNQAPVGDMELFEQLTGR